MAVLPPRSGSASASRRRSGSRWRSRPRSGRAGTAWRSRSRGPGSSPRPSRRSSPSPRGRSRSCTRGSTRWFLSSFDRSTEVVRSGSRDWEVIGRRQTVGDEAGRPGSAVGLDVVGDDVADVVSDGRRDQVGIARRVVHAPAGAVAVQAVPDVEVLLEVMPQREVEERPPAAASPWSLSALPARRPGRTPRGAGRGDRRSRAPPDRIAKAGRPPGSIRGPVTTTIRSSGVSRLANG